MKKIILNYMTILVVAFVSISFVSCGGNDDIGNNSLIQTLKSNKWISRDSSYGEGSNSHAWVDVETCFLYFTSDNAGVSYWVQKDYDTDLGNSIRTDYSLFTYSVSGNTVTITDEYGYVSRYNYEGGYLVSESGGTIFESSPMTSNDYELVRSLGPKKGTCGNNLNYTFDDRTKILTISGSGRMNDYNSSNQPWHDFAISKIVIKDGCTYVGTHAFNNLKYVVPDLDLPNSLLEIGDCAFCDLLISDLVVPTELVRIGNYAFSDCEYLKKVNFAGCNVLEEIGDYAFAFCPINMSSFTIPTNVKRIGSFSFFVSSFRNLTLNDKLESIGDQAFGEITSSKLEIPNSVKSIGSLAFRGSFSEIRIGTGLNTISGVPFVTSKSGRIYVNLGKPLPISSSDYQYIIGNIYGNNASGSWTLYVPKGSKSAYQNAAGWKTFGSIIEDASLTSGNGASDDNGNNGDNDNGQGGKLTGIANGHEYIDLGLSVKWATCNVGASTPGAFGDYFAWGETSKKSKYSWDTYQYYQNDACIDIGKDISGTEYDVAHVKWRGNWCMPTKEQVRELLRNTTHEVTKQNGVTGLKLTAKNGGSIFLPHSGEYKNTELRTEMYDGESYGSYWTSTLYEDYPGRACYFSISDGYAQMQQDRYLGCTIRAVLKN